MQKKKRVIDFTGFSVDDLGIVLKPATDNSNNSTQNADTQSGNIQKGITHGGGNAKPIRRSLHLTIIRDALYNALGDKNRAEVKLCEIQKELNIPPNTFYRHLKTLRNTEFEVNRLIYGTEIKKRGRVE